MSFSDASTQGHPEYSDIENQGKDIYETSEDHQQPIFDKEYGKPIHPVVSVAQSETLSPAPDGGATAWLQVVAAYFLFLNPWGMVNSFGVFQTYYDQSLGRSDSDISWIGTFQGFLLLFVGALTGPLYDKGYLHELVGSGAFLMVLGMMMTSISTEYYQVFLAQGLAIGLGGGLLFVPSVSILVQWFSTKRPLVLGICATGGSVGATIIPIIFRRLEPQIGFGWTTRVLGFIQFVTLLFSLIVVRRRVRPSGKARALIDYSAFRCGKFWATTGGIFFSFMGVYLPFFYMGSWAPQAVGTDANLSFYLLSILNAGSLFGRLLPGIFATRFGPLNIMFCFILITSVISFCWLAVDSTAATIVYCALYGFFSGVVISLPAVVITAITPDIYRTGTWMGMAFGIASFGLLIGNPIAGALIAAQNGSYVGMQIFGGCCVVAAATCLGIARYLHYRDGKTLGAPV